VESFLRKEKCEMCLQMGCVVLGEFGKWEKIDQVVLMVVDVHSELLFEDLVDPV
jgi:hypothetical protein